MGILNITRRTAFDKILCDKAFRIAKHLIYDGHQRRLALMIYKFFNKETCGGATRISNKSAIETKNISNKKIVEGWHILIIKKIQEKKSTITFKRQYLGCYSCWYAIDKQIW